MEPVEILEFLDRHKTTDPTFEISGPLLLITGDLDSGSSSQEAPEFLPVRNPRSKQATVGQCDIGAACRIHPLQRIGFRV